MRAALRRVLHPVLFTYFAAQVRTLQHKVRPMDATHQTIPGPDSDWILVVGGGTARGWGVESHADALPGQIGYGLTTRTHRGADIDVVPAGNNAEVKKALNAAAVSQYDVIVLTWGMAHAYTLRSARSWRRTIEGVIAALLNDSGVKSHIVVLATPPVRSILGFNDRLGRIVEEHTRELNEITAEACMVSERISYIDLPVGRDGITGLTGDGSGAFTTYQRWGDLIASRLVPYLGKSMPRVESRPNEEARQRAVDELTSREMPLWEINHIVAAARSAYGGEMAAFTLIDDNAQTIAAASGAPLDTAVKRSESACDVAMHHAGATVVPDTKADARFRHVPLIRFYAGHPIVSPDGHPVGMLCVMDSKPHTNEGADVVDTTLLRELAHMVEKRLWGEEDTPLPRSGS
jgi:GAF domain-containing protein